MKRMETNVGENSGMVPIIRAAFIMEGAMPKHQRMIDEMMCVAGPLAKTLHAQE